MRRPRRLRLSSAVRGLVRENNLTVNDLIQPIFVKPSSGQEEISSMPGIFRYGISELLKELDSLVALGIKSIALFPVVPENEKTPLGEFSSKKEMFYLKAIQEIKKRFPELFLISDVALDPYTTHGHDGLVDDRMNILNDESLPILADMACAQADAGADSVGPSDMMDGRVGFIRSALDENGFKNTLIISYAIKYASAFYGPFRDALGSAPKKGDKKTYQMDPANSREALYEAFLDEEENADILMIKPGLPYLDIISKVKGNSLLPIAAYNVSGEYSALKFASIAGAIDYNNCMTEVLLSFKRAGADIILTYHAKDCATLLWKNFEQ